RLRTLSREAARLADRVVATDEATRAEVPRHLGIDPSRVVVLPNGIDLDEIAAATPPDARAVAEDAVPGLRGAEPVFLSVGRLEAYKGFEDALDALGTLHAAGRLPPRWAWVLAGEGPAATRLRRAPPPAGRARVPPPGPGAERVPPAPYARADVFPHPTRYQSSR